MLLREISQHSDAVIAFLAVMNCFTFFLYAFDKSAAKNKGWRVSENRLLIFAALFGSAGAFLAMVLVRHKTRKAKFFVTVPILLIAQGLLLYYVMTMN